MAWRSSGKTNAELVENLWRNGLVSSVRVREAMKRVDRAHFTPSAHLAYEDSPQAIGHAATISAPHMHASAAESLLPFLRPGARVLDVGSGSGYLTAVFGELVFGEGESAGEGKVVGLEHIEALRDLGEGNLAKGERGKKWLAEGKVRFVVGDGRRGWVDGEGGDGEDKGWDAIHVGAAAREVHEELVRQLRKPGRMFIPVEDPHNPREQYIWEVDKDADGTVTRKKLYGVRYVPLTDAPK